MKIVPLARYLKEHAPSVLRSEAAACFPEPDPLPALPDFSPAVEEAYSRGLEEGQNAAQSVHKAALKASEERYETQLSEARTSWTAQQGQELATRIGEGMREIETAIAAVVARLLEPIIVIGARRQMLEELTAAIHDLWQRQPGIAMRVSGPADILDALKAKLDPGGGAEYEACDACDVRVEVGDSVIESVLASWIARLSGAAQ